MNLSLSNIPYRRKKTVVLVLAIVFSTALFSQSQNFLDKPYLETSATYTTEVTPDNIYLNILITENDTKGKVSVEETEKRMMQQLNDLGVDTKKQLKILDLTSDFKKSLLRKTDVLKNKEYRLLVHDAHMASKVVNALESVNISNIRLTKTEYSKLEALKIELKGKAVAKAKKQADVMLQSLDQKVGKALYISDAKTNFSGYQRGQNSALNTLNFAGAGDFDMDEVGIKKQKVRVEVTVFFEIL